MLAVRRAGAWFGWQPGEIMALPYDDFILLLTDEAAERQPKQDRKNYGYRW